MYKVIYWLVLNNIYPKIEIAVVGYEFRRWESGAETID